MGLFSKSLNTKIIGLMLGIFLFCPFLSIANNNNNKPGSCRSAIENLKNIGQNPNKDIKDIKKALESGKEISHWKSLEEIWKEILFDLELSPPDLADIIELAITYRYKTVESYEVIQKLIVENKELIRQEGIFDFPKLNLLEVNNVHYGNEILARRLPLIEAIEAENPKLVAIIKGLGADVYQPSPYNSETVAKMNGVVGSLQPSADGLPSLPKTPMAYRSELSVFYEELSKLPSSSLGVNESSNDKNHLVIEDPQSEWEALRDSLTSEPQSEWEALRDSLTSQSSLTAQLGANESLSEHWTDFRIKYPIPLALMNFSANFDTNRTQKIVQLLLESSDPDFRYDHDKLDQQFSWFVENLEMDRVPMYGVRDGASDLMLVAQYGTAEMLEFLIIQKGHDIKAEDKEEWSVENYAQLNKEEEREKILALLKEYKKKGL